MATPNLDLYNSYFDYPTLSDLTLKLSERTVHAHRIVLCHTSEYFTSLLAGKFRESASKEVELHEDNPKAMMVLLRYLYGNSYPTTDCYDESSIGTSLQDHAQIFVVADKYQIPKLRDEALENMKGIGFNEETFVPALRMIFNATTPNSIARKLMTDACVDQLYDLRLQDAFMALLPELPELAVEIVRHPHLTYRLGNGFAMGVNMIQRVAV